MAGGDDEPITQTTQIQLSPEQQQISRLALPFAQQFAQQPLQLPTGTGIAGFAPAELQAQQQLQQLAQTSPVAGQAGGALGNILSPGFLSPEANPALAAQQAAVADITTQNLLQNILPQIRGEAAVAQGPFGGSTREDVRTGVAVGESQRNLANTLAQLQAQNFQTALGGQLQGLGLAPQTQALGLFGPQTLAAVGGQQRGLEQARLGEARGQETLGQLLPLLQAQQLFGLLGAIPGAQGVTTVQGAQPGGPNPILAGLGGASAGSAIGGAIPGLAFGGPIGAGLGGGLGLLGSLLG